MYLLFIENDANDQRLIKSVMEEIDSNIFVVFAGNGAAALKWLEVTENVPDLLFININLPHMNGLETLAALKRHPRYRRVPAFILSANNDLASLSVARHLGAEGYIIKPGRYDKFGIRADKLRQCLRQVLSKEYTLPKSLRPDQFLHLQPAYSG